MTLGQKIRARRKELGMTMEDLGRAVGVQRSAINKYEKDMIKDPTRKIIAKFAKALDVSPMYLMDDESEIGLKRIEVPQGKRLFAMDTLQVRDDSRIRKDLGMVEVEGVEVDKETAALLNVWKRSKPETRKVIIHILKELSKGE